MKAYYQIRMENINEHCVIEAWQDWGGSNDKNKAIDIAKKVQKDIDAGKWDVRKRDGYKLQMVVEKCNDETLDLIEVIEIGQNTDSITEE
jgi:Fe-S-cluster-containing hydrogenase component 2